MEQLDHGRSVTVSARLSVSTEATLDRRRETVPHFGFWQQRQLGNARDQSVVVARSDILEVDTQFSNSQPDSLYYHPSE